MPLANVTLSVGLSFSESVTNADGWAPTTFGPDSIGWNLQGLNLATYKQMFAVQYSIAASGSDTLDLTSVSNFVCESFSYNGALTLLVLPTGSSCAVSPGASNPLTWFFGGSTQSVTIPAGGIFLFSAGVAGPAQTVDSTHKTLKFSNPGGTSLTVDVIILGST